MNVPILQAAKSIPKPAAKTAKPAISANRPYILLRLFQHRQRRCPQAKPNKPEEAVAPVNPADVGAAKRALDTAKKNLEEGKKERYGNERNYARYLERINGLEKAVRSAQENYDAAQRQPAYQDPVAYWYLPHQQGRLKFGFQTAFSSFQYNKIVFIPNKAFFPVFRRPC